MKKLVKFSFFIVFCFCSFSLLGQTFNISGNAKTYAGDTLKMYALMDYISKNEYLIAKAAVDKNGNFTFSGRISEITPAYIDLIVFKGLIYLQPGKNCEIVLPEKQEIAIQDKLNPYFKKREFYIKSINPDKEDLNYLIPEFEKHYNAALGKVLYSLKGISKASTDSIENAINQKFSSKNKYFEDYKNYRFAILDYTAYHRSKTDIVRDLFTNKDVLTNNLAYSEVFDEIFSNIFIAGKSSAITIKDLYLGIKDKSYNTLKKQFLANENVKSEKFADYLILKGLRDAYYFDSYPKENLVAIVDSMAQTCNDLFFRKIAANLSKDFTTLLCGYAPAQILLKDINDEEYYLEKSSGKFVYLTFFNPDSYTSNGDLELLKTIYKEVPPEMLDIVTIFVSQNKEDMKKLLQSDSDIKWKVLWYNYDNSLLKKYNIRAFPMYYLINPEGVLSMNPAPGPQEDFPSKFSAAYRSWKNEQYRKQYRENQGIK